MKQVFTSCFVHEKHTADKRNLIVSILKEIEGLSDAEVVLAGMLITKDNNLCDYFFTMDTPRVRGVTLAQLVKLLSCDCKVTGSSPGNNLLCKNRVRLRTIH